MQEGFARFAVQKYTNAPQQLNNKLVHLTNSSIQQERQANCFLPDFLLPSLTHAHGDTKTSFAHLWKLLAEKGISRDQLWEPICQTVLAAFYSAQDAIPNQVGFGVPLYMAHSAGGRVHMHANHLERRHACSSAHTIVVL